MRAPGREQDRTSSCCSTAMQSSTSRSVRDKPWGTPVHVVGQPADARRTSANAASTIGRGHDLGMPPLRSPPPETLSAIFHRNRFETTKHTVAIWSPLTPLSRVESITLTCVCDGRQVEEGTARDWAYRRERHHVSPQDEELQPADWPAEPRNRAPGQPIVFRRPPVCQPNPQPSRRQFHHRNGRAPPSSLLSSTTTTTPLSIARATPPVRRRRAASRDSRRRNDCPTGRRRRPAQRCVPCRSSGYRSGKAHAEEEGTDGKLCCCEWPR